MAKRPEIVIVDGPFAGRRFDVKDGGLRLGRSSSSDICIPDEELSRNHCLFEAVGEDGLRVTDLASANGTFLNGAPLGGEPAALKAGDEITVGATHLRIGGAQSDGAVVDLGLGDAGENAAPQAAKRRSPVANILWAVALLSAGAAIFVVMTASVPEKPEPRVVAQDDVAPRLREVQYERVAADTNGIFRYYMTLSQDGVLSVRIDDVPKENRHHVKSQPLSQEALDDLNEILSFEKIREIDPEYAGMEPPSGGLESWELGVVYDSRAKKIRVVNTQEPEAFRAVREKLEAFSKSQLGIWAIQYPREKLIELAKKAIEIGDVKWADRDANHGNLSDAIAAYKEALFYLETVNPKPDCATAAGDGLRRATEELDRRYGDQRFLADRALNLSQWETARSELLVLLEMVPDRRDDRNRDARAKLISAEDNLKKKGGRR